eukprot:scaffold1850_cov194-Pinguiococcus_pyrenoidosus.AAC.27
MESTAPGSLSWMAASQRGRGKQRHGSEADAGGRISASTSASAHECRLLDSERGLPTERRAARGDDPLVSSPDCAAYASSGVVLCGIRLTFGYSSFGGTTTLTRQKRFLRPLELQAAALACDLHASANVRAKRVDPRESRQRAFLGQPLLEQYRGEGLGPLPPASLDRGDDTRMRHHLPEKLVRGDEALHLREKIVQTCWSPGPLLPSSIAAPSLLESARGTSPSAPLPLRVPLLRLPSQARPARRTRSPTTVATCAGRGGGGPLGPRC